MSCLLYIWLTQVITKWRVRHQKRVANASTAVSSKAVETLTSFEAIKMFATERLETVQYSELRRELQNASIETKWLMCMFQFGQSIVMGVGLLVGMTLTVQDGECISREGIMHATVTISENHRF